MTLPDLLRTALAALRERMLRRLQSAALEPDERREMEMALQTLEVMKEELEGQAALLVRENERYARFFEFGPDAYLITDARGGIREANQSALELLRGEREAVLGRRMSDFVAPEERVGFLERSAGATRRVHMRSAAGDAFAAELTARAIGSRKGGAGELCWLLRTAD